jgi:hypothetical protein
MAAGHGTTSVTRSARLLCLLVLSLLTLGSGSVAHAETREPLAAFAPLPAAAPPSDAARAARDRLLGDRWDDPDHVTLHWTGVSSFVVTIGGHLLLFDAWEIIGAVEGYLPLTREDLAALEPEAVLVGHGHFDHAGDLGYVAGLAGAVVVGSEEICTVALLGAEREGVPTDFRCAITGTQISPEPGVAQSFRLFADLPPVTVLQHVHSAARPPGEGNELDPFLPVMDPQPYLDHLADDPEELARFLAQQEEQSQGGTWLYHLQDGDFTLLLGDSAGPIFEAPEVREALTHFPGCVDVLSNAILGFDQPVSGLQDPVDYVDLVKPQVFLPSHADAWAPVISAGQEQYREQLLAELGDLEHVPEVDFLLDPQDYLVQRAYRVADPRWTTAVPGSTCATAAAGLGPVSAPAPPVNDGVATAPAGGERGRPLPATGPASPLLALALLAAALVARRLIRP